MRKYKRAALFAGAVVVFAVLAMRNPSGPSLPQPACTSCLLLIEPDAGIAPLAQMIAHASSTIDLVIYEFSDAILEDALAAAAARGVAVRVLFNKGFQGEPSGSSYGINVATFYALRAQGIAVRWTSPYFNLTHQKTLIVDRDAALIMSFNLVSQYFATSRDFGVLDESPQDVSNIESTFNADWDDARLLSDTTPHTGFNSDLVWSPDARPALLNMINSARATLDVYNEEMLDPEIIAALKNAAVRGVHVRIIMTYNYSWKRALDGLAANGVDVRAYGSNAKLYIHAKAIIADADDRAPLARAFIGSENFSTSSLDMNRELGIVIAGAALAPLEATFIRDWQDAVPLSIAETQR